MKSLSDYSSLSPTYMKGGGFLSTSTMRYLKYGLGLAWLLAMSIDLLAQSSPTPQPRTNQEYRAVYRRYTQITRRRWETGLGPYYHKPWLILPGKRKALVDEMYRTYVSIEDYDSLRDEYTPLALIPQRIARFERNARYDDSLYQATGDTLSAFFAPIDRQMAEEARAFTRLSHPERMRLYEQALEREKIPEAEQEPLKKTYFDQRGNAMEVSMGIKITYPTPKQARQRDRWRQLQAKQLRDPNFALLDSFLLDLQRAPDLRGIREKYLLRTHQGKQAAMADSLLCLLKSFDLKEPRKSTLYYKLLTTPNTYNGFANKQEGKQTKERLMRGTPIRTPRRIYSYYFRDGFGTWYFYVQKGKLSYAMTYQTLMTEVLNEETLFGWF